jgi:hypothetical protein
MRHFEANEISQARSVDPSRFLAAHGLVVVWARRHLNGNVVTSEGQEVYRFSNIKGNYVFCTHEGNKVGQYSKNIDLVMELDGISFGEAVARLLELDSSEPPEARSSQQTDDDVPTMPPEEGRGRGRDYLRGRGISNETILEAENKKFIRYCADGVLFVGYDELGRPRCATKRASAHGLPAEESKRDLRGSNKGFSPILLGNPEMLYIVEGGVDALALRDIALRRGKNPPTTVVSGGSLVRKFLANERVKTLIFNAKQICIMCENEDSESTQMKTDYHHSLQTDEVRSLAPMNCAVMVRWPRVGCKDLADQNKQEAYD